MSDRLAILIGNGRFEGDPSLPELFGPRHDVASLGRLLSDPEVGNYIVLELVERDSKELLAEIEPLIAMAAPGANVLVYYAGCVISEPGRGLFLATTDTRLDDVKTTALPVAALKALLRRSAATDLTIVMDCCYVSPAGRVDEADVEHELRRVRADVSPDLHLIASPAATRAAADRETATETGLEGALTRCIVDGLATGAADRDGDNTTKTSELNEYLGIRLGDARPLWAGPLEGADPEIVANPHPIDGIDVAYYDPMVEVREGVRRLVLGAAGVLLLLSVVVAALYFLGGGETRRVEYLEDVYADQAMPDSAVRVDDLDVLRGAIDRTGWVEHTEPFDGAGPRYPEAVSFRLDPGNNSRPGTVDLHLRQWAQLEFGEGVYAIGVTCGEGLNIAEVVVELTDGDQFVLDVRTEQAGTGFFGFVGRRQINRVRINSTSSRFVATTLYIYADREYERAGGGMR